MDNLTEFQRDQLYVIARAAHPSGQDVLDNLEDYSIENAERRSDHSFRRSV